MEMYFIALVLPGELNEKIREYKTWMKEKYGCQVGLKSPAHITLIPPFWMSPEFEATLITDLDHFHDFPSFTLCTAGFSCFRPRTIFIALAENETLHALKKDSDQFFQDKPYPAKPDNRPFHPHITIATRDLHKKDFAEAWPYFEKKQFEFTWKAKGVSLLKHNKKNWDVVHTSQFKEI